MGGVTVKGLDEIINATATTARRAKDMRPAMEQALAYMVTNSAPERFETSTAPNGKKWKPHAASTRRALARERRGRTAFGGRSSLLIRSGLLRSSVVSGTTVRLDETSFSYGSNLPYARVHQFGVSRVVRVPSHTRKRTKRKKLNAQQKRERSKARKDAARQRKIKEKVRRNKLSPLERAREDEQKRLKKKANSRPSATQTNKGPVRVKAHTKKMRIPARPYLGFTDEDLEVIKDIVIDYLLMGEE